MALHVVKEAEPDDGDQDLFAGPLSERVLPKHRIPEHPSDPRAVYAMLHAELQLDGDSAQNLATFCTTWSDDEVHRLMDECLGKNMIDKDEYPQTAEIESRCVRILADLWNAPAGHDTMGCSTTGSSEAAMLGGLAMKWRWRRRRAAEAEAEARAEAGVAAEAGVGVGAGSAPGTGTGAPAERPNLVCGPVQVCWEKFARYFDVELRQVPLEPGATGLRPHQLAGHVDRNTIGVVAIVGVTYTCDYEPVAELAAELDRIQDETGVDVPIHVDAASGGFVAPFVQPELAWDFRVERVVSINASGHKYGLAPLGVGWAVWRSAELLPEELIFRVNYLGGDMPTFALNFSRPGGEVIAQYYMLLRLGREGYRRVQQACVDSARHLAGEIAAMGPFELLYDGRGALPAVSYRLKDDPDPGFTLYDLSEQLSTRGWQVPSYPLPAHRDDTVVQRILVRHGVSRDEVSLLADDIRRCLDRLGHRSTGAPAQPGFHH
ncbi:glutamate decarboxylase [Actinomadura xylanilytica]|uniref:glutamate decarboxylase n=1 Tax=Actinomadura xylanilytica TaxID=887459 RepID=UPI00255B3546|nr:glutamate decarboxylase [Actinomadura xylanilytica]MDL4773118.1 glutamate decarboxylase [Actinomadura xylanilytica]